MTVHVGERIRQKVPVFICSLDFIAGNSVETAIERLNEKIESLRKEYSDIRILSEINPDNYSQDPQEEPCIFVFRDETNEEMASRLIAEEARKEHLREKYKDIKNLDKLFKWASKNE